MSAAAWGAVATVVGPTLVFITWLVSRRQEGASAASDMWAQINRGALDTTKTMSSLIAPMQAELRDRESELSVARREIERLTISLEDARRELAEYRRTHP